MRLLKIVFTALAFCSLFSGTSYASDYPNKPVTILAPVAPGGGLDLIARTVAERLTKSLGQNFLVDNQSGGGGIIASQKAARATGWPCLRAPATSATACNRRPRRAASGSRASRS